MTERTNLKRMTEVASLGLPDDIQPVRFQAHLLDEAYSLVTNDCEVASMDLSDGRYSTAWYS